MPLRLNLSLTLAALLTLGACGDTPPPSPVDGDTSSDSSIDLSDDGPADTNGTAEEDVQTTSGGDGGKFGRGQPYSSYSFFSLNAAAWMGMPVQWKANGNSAFLPSKR